MARESAPAQAGASTRAEDMPFRTIEALARALARRDISSLELTEIYLDRIQGWDPRLHAYALVFDDLARRAARASDALRAGGHALGPLHGIPIAVKDIFDCADHPTQAGSSALTGRVPAMSAHAVRRLEAAGMVVLGKTHMVEFGFGGWGTNPVKGTPWNPRDLETHRVPGGSSSGSAVAVAAGLAPAALGTDTGGSIRTPAAWCGVVGLKTSSGLIGRQGTVPLCPTHDTVGPLARSVRDTALLLGALAGVDPLDPETFHAPALSPLADIELGIEGLRIGVLQGGEMNDIHQDIRHLFDLAVEELGELGAQLDAMSPPRRLEDYVRDGGDIMSAESYAHLGCYVEAACSPVDPAIRARILRGRDVSASAYIRLLERRRQAQAEFLAALDQLDALVTPTCPQAAIPVSEVDEAVAPNIFGRFVNFLDLASLSIPIGLTNAGLTNAGLPAGLQIVTRRYGDSLALRIGRAFERARGMLFVRPPGL